ncbi:tyrosine-type recombinase/integrase [Ketogulonicigenium vulgare]|uniref:tyrosine-type recombinase/integrase n=1 Tax=Ketogulonicigenium vulgare TaxID=92945 RepID=UPI00235A175F|nr:tyrosine-type recombinase/integrase [Ketogulonicigenium vulgare]
MAGKLRYWKEKDGRFWARLAVPSALKNIIGKSELLESLGGDRRTAIKNHPAAVARLQAQVAEAEAKLIGKVGINPNHTAITTGDFGQAVWQRYNAALNADAAQRDSEPTPEELEVAKKITLARLAEIDTTDALAVLDATLDYLVLRNVKENRQFFHNAQLDELRRNLADGDMHNVQHEVDAYLDQHRLTAGDAERAVLAKQLIRAEIEAVQRSVERDAGDYSGKPSDPLVKPAAEPPTHRPVSLSKLWENYVASRVMAGFMKDRGKRQDPVIRNLRKFLGHNDARLIAKKDLLAWRDNLIAVEKLSAKTVSDIYVSTVRSLFLWAYENEHLPENVAATVKQAKPRKVQSRERGYTDAEAVEVLRLSRNHQPKPNQFGYIRETAHMTAAKRWAPMLCAFTGARISEVTQLRKEDMREENGRWIIRITPDAGSVKSGGYRDVPLHRQIIEQGFIKFVLGANAGPLFHGADKPVNYARAASSVSDEISKWLRKTNVAPEGVQPNHGWRHRLKTQAMELGLNSRVIDAMQGHTGRTAGENYGDVTLNAKMRVIDQLPDYPL